MSNDLHSEDLNGIPYGTIIDSDLKELFSKKIIIKKNVNLDNIKQACYDLCVGDFYFDVLHEDKRKPVPEEGMIIKPKQCVVILTKEEVDIPYDCLARVLTKGKLFSLGLSAVNTYLDPGFHGSIGIVLHNLSNQSLIIKNGTEIAKIEFIKLNRVVSKPYRGRPYNEDHTWRIPKDYIYKYGEEQKEIILEDVAISHGNIFHEILCRIFKFDKIIWGLIFLTSFLLIMVSAIVLFFPNYAGLIQGIWSIIASFLVGVLSSCVVYIATSRSIKKRNQ